MPADLLMIVPTRGQPTNAKRLVDAFTETATGHARLLLAVDGDWDNADAYREIAWSAGHGCSVMSWRGMVATLNAEAAIARCEYPMVGFCGDDHIFRTHGWDKALVEALWELGTGVAYGNDLLQGENLPTAVALTSNIVRELGYMAPPALRHLYIDEYWRDLGRAIDRITYLPDVIIEHLHPSAGKA